MIEKQTIFVVVHKGIRIDKEVDASDDLDLMQDVLKAMRTFHPMRKYEIVEKEIEIES